MFLMFKMGGSALCLLILTVFFTFSYVGCVQEEVGPQASLEEDVVLARKGDVDDLYKDFDPDADCNCYMSVTGAYNFSAEAGHFWTLEDITIPSGPGMFALAGNSSGWWEQSGSGPLQDYPSPYYPLDPVDAGCHEFFYGNYSDNPGEPVPEDAVLYTKVRCYNGNGDLQTEVNYTFMLSNGFPDPYLPGFAHFWRLVSCVYQTANPNGSDPYDCRLSSGVSH